MFMYKVETTTAIFNKSLKRTRADYWLCHRCDLFTKKSCIAIQSDIEVSTHDITIH